jgi:demethylmenaquinone methyltransferase/2-methoxy-6-polyprenyl-1,4-benzoquinol methylase
VSRRRGPPERFVRALFDGVADRYDLMNDVLSFGLHRRWRRQTVDAVEVRPEDLVLDVGCGTGGLSRLLEQRGTVVGMDLSHRMLLRARERAGPRLGLAEASALRLPFGDRIFGAVASAFVLRNLQDLRVAFREIARVLTPGGSVALLDITEPSHRAIRWAFDRYLRAVAPTAGALAGSGHAYRYLARSLDQLPPAGEVCGSLAAAGFLDCRARSLSGGAVTLFTGRRSGP